MVLSKQVDVVGTSGTETKTVSGRRQSAREKRKGMLHEPAKKKKPDQKDADADNTHPTVYL